jgi:hypothetical protein
MAVERFEPEVFKFFETCSKNLNRIEHLIIIYRALSEEGSGDDHSDILRAATVLLHASIEEFLRGLAEWRWPQASADVISRVPLAGTGVRGQAEKFFLGALIAHKGKSVDDLIKASIKEHLGRANFNSTDDIATHLKSVGIEVTDEIRSCFPALGQLMTRRHRIVHRADLGPDQNEPSSITAPEVDEWNTVATTFFATILRPYYKP